MKADEQAGKCKHDIVWYLGVHGWKQVAGVGEGPCWNRREKIDRRTGEKRDQIMLGGKVRDAQEAELDAMADRGGPAELKGSLHLQAISGAVARCLTDQVKGFFKREKDRARAHCSRVNLRVRMNGVR